MPAIFEKGEIEPREELIAIDDAILPITGDIGSSQYALELSAPPKLWPGSFICQKG